MLGLARPVTDELLQEWQELLYDSCTLCGRCAMVCPVGNDISYMVRKAREGMVASGNSPQMSGLPLNGLSASAVPWA